MLTKNVAALALVIVAMPSLASAQIVLPSSQYSGDIGNQINEAYESSACSPGCVITIASGTYHFSTQIVLGNKEVNNAYRPVSLQFGYSSMPNVGTQGTSQLIWTGSANSAVALSCCGGVRISGLDLQNQGSANYGIAVDSGYAQLSNVTVHNDVSPAVQFSDAAVAVGDATNAPAVSMQHVNVVQAAPIGFDVVQVNDGFECLHCRAYANPVGFQLGDLNKGTDAGWISLIDTEVSSAFAADPIADIQILRVYGLTLTNDYFETSPASPAILVPSNAALANEISARGCFFSHQTTTQQGADYPVQLYFGPANVNISDSEFIGYPNNTTVVENTKSTLVRFVGNRLEFTGSLASNTGDLRASDNVVAGSLQ